MRYYWMRSDWVAPKCQDCSPRLPRKYGTTGPKNSNGTQLARGCEVVAGQRDFSSDFQSAGESPRPKDPRRRHTSSFATRHHSIAFAGRPPSVSLVVATTCSGGPPPRRCQSDLRRRKSSQGCAVTLTTEAAIVNHIFVHEVAPTAEVLAQSRTLEDTSPWRTKPQVTIAGDVVIMMAPAPQIERRVAVTVLAARAWATCARFRHSRSPEVGDLRRLRPAHNCRERRTFARNPPPLVARLYPLVGK